MNEVWYMLDWRVKIPKEVIIGILEKEKRQYLLYEESILPGEIQKEILIVDFKELEDDFNQEYLQNVMRETLENGRLVFVLYCRESTILQNVVGVGVKADFVVLKLVNNAVYMYIADGVKCFNTTVYTHKKTALQRQYLFENERRKSKQQFSMMREEMKEYLMRQEEMIHSILRGDAAFETELLQPNITDLIELCPEYSRRRTVYLVLFENYYINREQQVLNNIIIKIQLYRKEDNSQIVQVGTEGTRISPIKKGRILADEESDRGYFLNNLEFEMKSEELIRDEAVRKDFGVVDGYDILVKEAQNSVRWSCQLGKTREGIISLYQYEVKYDRPYIAELPKTSKTGFDFSVEACSDMMYFEGKTAGLIVSWIEEYYACRVPIPSMIWHKKIEVENNIFLSLNMSEI